MPRAAVPLCDGHGELAAGVREAAAGVEGMSGSVVEDRRGEDTVAHAGDTDRRVPLRLAGLGVQRRRCRTETDRDQNSNRRQIH